MSAPFTSTTPGMGSINLSTKERQSGWVLQAVISRASFRGLPRKGKSFFTMMSQYINNRFAKKRGIGQKLLLTVRTVMLQEHVDMVAGDFNGAAWRRQSGSDPRPISTIEEEFANKSLPVPPGPTPLWRPGGVPGEWSDVCGFLKPPGSEREWQVRMHGTFTSSTRIKAAITKFGFTSFRSMLGWLTVCHRMTDLDD